MPKSKFQNADIGDLPEKYQKLMEDKNKNGTPDFLEGKNGINVKNLPEKYQKVFEDKNKNGKPDFFEDNLINILKKIYNLFTQKDPHLYGYKKVNPSSFQIILLVLGLIVMATLGMQFLPFLIILVIFYLNKNKSGSQKANQTTQASATNTHSFTKQNLKPEIPASPTDNLNNSFSNGFRVVLLIGLIIYCFYLARTYL